MTSHEDGDGRGWSLLPPNADEIKKEGQEKFLLISDSGSAADTAFSVNWMGLAIAFIIILIFMQLASPGLRQIGDFVGAIYSPYTTYGQDEVNRYDTYYGDYTEEAVGGSRQYRHFTEASNLLSELINGQNAETTPFGTEKLADGVALDKVSASRSVPLID